jgi:hypothetical protein
MMSRLSVFHWVAVSSLLHMLGLLAATLFIARPEQPYTTETPWPGLEVPAHQPEPIHRARPPVTARVFDKGPYLLPPEEHWPFGEAGAVHQHDESATESTHDSELPGPPHEEQARGRFADRDAPEGLVEFEVDGQADAISDVPTLSTGVVALLGVGGGGAGQFGDTPEEQSAPPKSGCRVSLPAASDDAIQAALDWLVRHQLPDGSWSVSRCGGSMSDEFGVGVTGLATLLFVSRGHTPSGGRYRDTVREAVRFLVDAQGAEGELGRNDAEGNGAGLNHAIAGQALVEVHRRVNSSWVGKCARKAVRWTWQHQLIDGGWGLNGKGARSDAVVTCWHVMQLRSALSVGISVPGMTFQRAYAWLAGCRREGGGGRAEPSEGADKGPAALLASAARMRALASLGCGGEGLRHFLDRILAHEPRFPGSDLHYWFHAYAAVSGVSDIHGRQWRELVTERLVSLQTWGSDGGSWAPEGDPWGRKAGRAFTTALGALILDGVIRCEAAQKELRREALRLHFVAPTSPFPPRY